MDYTLFYLFAIIAPSLCYIDDIQFLSQEENFENNGIEPRFVGDAWNKMKNSTVANKIISTTNDVGTKLNTVVQNVKEKLPDPKKVVSDLIENFKNICKCDTDLHTCSCCAHMKYMSRNDSICVKANIIAANLTANLGIHFNDREMAKKQSSLQNLPRICSIIPPIPAAFMCLRLHNLGIVDKMLRSCFQVEAGIGFTAGLGTTIAAVGLPCLKIGLNDIDLEKSNIKPDSGYFNFILPTLKRNLEELEF